MKRAKTKKTGLLRRKPRQTAHTGKRRDLLSAAVLRSLAAGVGAAILMLCLLSMIFANTALPLKWMEPAACGAAALGSFVSGLLISRRVPRLKLLAGAGFGVFYCLCAVVASLLSSRIPTTDSSNLSLLAVMVLGALTGSAAGALQASGQAGGRT